MTVKKDALSKPKAKTALKGQSWRKNIMERKYSCRPAYTIQIIIECRQVGREGGRLQYFWTAKCTVFFLHL
jgi:hypothetical protein